jgi:hypothetical protein
MNARWQIFMISLHVLLCHVESEIECLDYLFLCLHAREMSLSMYVHVNVASREAL